jgi:hypothetical protein
MELVNITYAGEGVQPQDLNVIDRPLVTSNFINSKFGETNDYLELYIYDENNNLLTVDYEAFDYYPYLTANPKNNTYSSLTLDPETDVKNRGFNRGNLNIQYNFYKRLFNSQYGRFYWIKDISTSRTEIKLSSQTISDLDIRNGFNQYQAYTSTKNYYPVFYLNFGNNQLVVANNVAFTEDTDGSYLVIKLYEALPAEFDIKSQLWIIDKIAESVSFNVNIQVQAENLDQINRLRGPNYSVKINDKNGKTTPYYNYDNLLASNVSSSYQKLLSYYQDRSVAINVDYSNFSNFIHFSSAVERVSNFAYKLQLIESKSIEIGEQQNIVGGTSNSTIINNTITAAQTYINNIIEKFDPYEYFLYFDSSSFAWPKRTTTQPYVLYSITSSQASNFLGGINTIPTPTTQSLLFSASYYDATNKDLLHNSVPQYLLDDPSNQPYVTFLDMIGQHFDNIWIYYKDLSNRFNATNNPDTGISLDVVSDALRGFGIQLYTNSNVSDNLYYTLFGINPDGSLLPPTGSEVITNYVTSSLETLSAKNIQQEIYKRLYHNLPYLLKTKGTERGVKALISTFGIPDTILTVREFGGAPIDSVDGIFDLDSSEYKLAIVTGSNGNVTGSLTLSSSLLSPFTSIQYYQNNNRLNNTNVEVGFSPADVINANITASQGYFDINQLIGAPGYQYSASYQPLVSASNAYFATYTQPNSIWEYIRLIKFYNNSLFKMIKDFVPARANVSTGIIVKSHMLERNKYARNEPIVTFNDYSQSIDMLTIDAGDGGAISGSTYWDDFVITPLGLASYTSSQNMELYNGELNGSEIVVTNGDALNQKEASNLPGTGSGFIEVNLGALYQNVTASVRSIELFDLDYNSDQLLPVNYGIVTQSINNAQIDNYATYTNPNSPYAQVQDYNYNLERSVIPRYRGSQTVSSEYNTESPANISYGDTAAIDKIKYQYAYLVDIYSSSLLLPNRSNAQIKYIIDNNQNVLDLTKANKNIFTVQNIFKSQETTNISLFNYDEANPYTQQLVNNPNLQIYEGGWRYLPILHNISGSPSTSQIYNLDNPTSITIEGTSGGGGGAPIDPNDPHLEILNYSINYWSIETPDGFGNSDFSLLMSASYIGSGGAAAFNVTLNANSFINIGFGACSFSPIVTSGIVISSGSTTGYVGIGELAGAPSTGNGSGESIAGGAHWPSVSLPSTCTINIGSITAGASGGGGGENVPSFTYYTSFVTSSQVCLYYISESNQVIFNSDLAYYYSRGLTFQSTSDLAWTSSILDPVILPFTLNVGDKISFYDSASRLGWNEAFEYTIKNVVFTGSGETGSRIYTELDRPVNLALFNSGSGNVDAFSNAPWRACRYVVWKHVPDETNIMLRYNPKDASIVENGLLFPQYIDPTIRDNSGNVVKALKQQNLIQ